MFVTDEASSSLWTRVCDRFAGIFSGADPRVCVAFWLFGAYGLHGAEIR